jgi:hypothetical protein
MKNHKAGLVALALVLAFLFTACPGGAPLVTYTISLASIDNGHFSAPKSAVEGTTVTVKAVPDSGYEMDGKLTIRDNLNHPVEFIEKAFDEWTFRMPASNVQIKGEFKKFEVVLINTMEAMGKLGAKSTWNEIDRLNELIKRALTTHARTLTADSPLDDIIEAAVKLLVGTGPNDDPTGSPLVPPSGGKWGLIREKMFKEDAKGWTTGPLASWPIDVYPGITAFPNPNNHKSHLYYVKTLISGDTPTINPPVGWKEDKRWPLLDYAGGNAGIIVVDYKYVVGDSKKGVDFGGEVDYTLWLVPNAQYKVTYETGANCTIFIKDYLNVSIGTLISNDSSLENRITRTEDIVEKTGGVGKPLPNPSMYTSIYVDGYSSSNYCISVTDASNNPVMVSKDDDDAVPISHNFSHQFTKLEYGRFIAESKVYNVTVSLKPEV